MKRAKKKALFIEVSEDLAARLKALCEKSRRTLTAEVTLAIEAWLGRQRGKGKRRG